MSDGTPISTNPQSWIQTYTPSRPLRKAKENVYAGISVKWFYIIGFWSFVSLILFAPAVFVNNWIFTCLDIAVVLAWWVLYIAYFRTVEVAKETLLTLKFMFDAYMGHNKVCKFGMSVEALQTYIPIVEILVNGVIRFTQNKYGLLIQYWPIDKSDEQLEQHYLGIQAIIHRLSGDMMENWIVSSRFGKASPLLKKIEKKLNDPKLSRTKYALWESQYQKIKSGKDTPDSDFYLFLGLGTCETPEAAQEKLLEELPAILDGFDNATILAEQIVSESELVTKYMRFMIPRDLL